MITINPDTLANAIRELNERALLNTLSNKIDWFRVLDDLKRAGVDCAEVARRLGCAHSTVIDWKAKKTPTLMLALGLIQLHHTVIHQKDATANSH